MQTTIKEDEHFWHFRDELFSNVRQEQHEGMHTFNNRITTLVNNCKLTDKSIKETIKIMLLSHAVRYHKARDWIRLQDQSTLAYQSLSNHCKLLGQWCEQYKKAQLKGKAQLTTLTAATSTTSSVCQDAITTHTRQPKCQGCGYSHLQGDCPATNQWCYNCNGIGHYFSPM